MKLLASQNMKDLKQLYGHFKLHTSSTDIMVTMHRRNQYMSESIDRFYCRYSDDIGTAHCSTGDIGSLHIDSSQDGVGCG